MTDMQTTPPEGMVPVSSSGEFAPGAVASMVCGIVGFVAGCVPFAGIVLGIIAIVMFSKSSKAIIASGGVLQGKGMGIAGLVLGILAIVSSFFALIYWIIMGAALAAIPFLSQFK
jgi:hypothetical protein